MGSGKGRVITGQRWLGLISLGLAFLFLLAACGGGGSGDGGAGDRFGIVAYQGEDALGGKESSLTRILGQGKPVIVNFWAGLCPPCRREMPDFQEVYEEYRDRLILVGIDVGPFVGLGSHDDARRLLAELNITYPAAYAVSSDILREYEILGMPTTIFFTGDGKVFRKSIGFLPRDEMRQAVEGLLNASR